jgi:hypothetical protein
MIPRRLGFMSTSEVNWETVNPQRVRMSGASESLDELDGVEPEHISHLQKLDEVEPTLSPFILGNEGLRASQL